MFRGRLRLHARTLCVDMNWQSLVRWQRSLAPWLQNSLCHRLQYELSILVIIAVRNLVMENNRIVVIFCDFNKVPRCWCELFKWRGVISLSLCCRVSCCVRHHAKLRRAGRVWLEGLTLAPFDHNEACPEPNSCAHLLLRLLLLLLLLPLLLPPPLLLLLYVLLIHWRTFHFCTVVVVVVLSS